MKKFLFLNLLRFFLLSNLIALSPVVARQRKSTTRRTQKTPITKPVKAAENRIKCTNNLKIIGNAFLSFAADNNERMPWHLDPSNAANQFGETNTKVLGNILAAHSIRAELLTHKILLSPCDPDQKEANEKLAVGFNRRNPEWDPKKDFDPRENKPIPTDGVSYALCLGGDTLNPTTVLALTRNISGADLKDATFKGGVMKGLKESQGQLVTADGAVQLLDNKGLAEKVKAHTESRGAGRQRCPEHTLGATQVVFGFIDWLYVSMAASATHTLWLRADLIRAS